MEVILIENIEKLGKVGDIVKVKDGYARNYLIPKKKVLRASKENLKVFEEKKSIIENEEKKRKETAIETSSKIKDLEIIILRNAGENGQLYGSVTSKDIIKEISILKKVDLLNEQINLKKTLKSIGVFEVDISVYTDLKTKILLSIAKTKELGSEQIKDFKNPKKVEKKQVKDDKDKKVEKTDKTKDLNTKDMIKEIEKKEEKVPEKKITKKKPIIKKEEIKKTAKVKKKPEKKVKKTKKK
ncbi:MAG: 50S ribosomal protein L9 [Alphaproteobacteria bacterium MarineAlpha6_Bin6]|nr:MAG: 50S ribosomal protein L9 [Alphaproteobacteria bacterium MarineAlpha6_Bin6]PPR32746.1 MAG: 50S ribosomal protein L9 [Alphaproteobacteria bacterium MarineAlpha6_Bin5]|tara:strand:+ start:689 stop:1411 length:723 start_codon:yes stop_codon:yes gene_type:complete